MSRYHAASGMLRRADPVRGALPALSNPRTEAIIENWPIGRQRCRAWFAVESGPRGERASRRTENRDRSGWNAPKLTTYALRTRIADGDDGRTYVVRDVHSHINVMRGDMQHDAGNAFPGDPQYAALLSLFDPPGAAVTACRHGGLLTEETCATCLAEAAERAEHAPFAAEPIHAGLDAVDLEAERLGRGMGPSKSFVRPPAVRRRTRAPQGSRGVPSGHAPKKYRCRRCGHVAEQTTNHWGPTWSWGRVNACPECPPWAKYPEYGGQTVWDCVDEPGPEGNGAAGQRAVALPSAALGAGEERFRHRSDPGAPLPPRLPDGTRVHVRSEQFAEECDGVVMEGEYDGGWLYRIEVTAGDRLEAHRTPRANPSTLFDTPEDEGELWVCDFEVQPI